MHSMGKRELECENYGAVLEDVPQVLIQLVCHYC